MVSFGRFHMLALLLRMTAGMTGRKGGTDYVDEGILTVAAAGGADTPVAAKAESVILSPIIWVPGITSTALKASIEANHADEPTNMEKRLEKCYGWRNSLLPDATGYFPLYPSTSVKCIQEAMSLMGSGTEGDCIQDQSPLDIRTNGEVGLGKAIGTEDGYGFGLLDSLRSAFEGGAGYSKGDYELFYYDWRKYGDPCWNKQWLALLRQNVQERVQQSGKKVTLGCHSMGCQLLHVFLNQPFATPQWKADHIEHFIATGPPFAGAAMVMQALIEGPVSRFSTLIPPSIGQSVIATMPGFYELLPSQGMGDAAWHDENGNAKELMKLPDGQSLTVESLYDGTFVAAVEKMGIDVPLKHFMKNALTDNMKLEPPGVPTTCMYIVDVDTPSHFTYSTGSTKSAIDGVSEGDGTVNREAMEGPCKWFQSVQREAGTGPVVLMPLKLNQHKEKKLWNVTTWMKGPPTNHVSMLADTGEGRFLDQLAGVIRDGPPSDYHDPVPVPEVP